VEVSVKLEGASGLTTLVQAEAAKSTSARAAISRGFIEGKAMSLIWRWLFDRSRGGAAKATSIVWREM
jgi:hypothetical protein